MAARRMARRRTRTNQVRPFYAAESLSCKQLVRTFKSRWRIERSYEDLKGELGLDHYEGRSFVGWHHHVSVVLACYAFLVAEHVRSFLPSTGSESFDGSFRDAA